MTKRTLGRTILTTLALAIGACHSMEAGNVAIPERGFNETLVRANWNFSEYKNTNPGLFSYANDEKIAVKVLEIKNDYLKFEEDKESDVLYVAIPCTGERTLIIRKGKDIDEIPERGIRALMKCAPKKIRSFSAPIISITNPSFEFHMNHKGDDGLVRKHLNGVNKGFMSLTSGAIEEFVGKEKEYSPSINSPFTFVFIDSTNNNRVLVSGQVTNPNGMFDSLGNPIESVSKKSSKNGSTNSTLTDDDACRCIVS